MNRRPGFLRPGPIVGLLLAALALGLPGCAANPTTGRGQFFLISQAQEAEIGAQQNPQVIQAFGGVYDDARLAAYVDRVGRRLADQTGQPGIPFTFTVLDSDVVNAFALPGGYVYITRGLLALANSEAEVASVLAHEISHVTARHSAERYSQAALAQLGIGLLGAATGSAQVAQLAGVGAQAYLSSYSRDQESEADVIGIRYLAAAGYDPRAMASFLGQMERESRLRSRITGETEEVSFFATHPQTADRIAQAFRLAAAAPADGAWNGAEYLAAIDGMVYGESAASGIVQERRYGNVAAGVRWEAPDGFRMQRSRGKVVAEGPADSGIVFDMAAPGGSMPAMLYLTEAWADGVPLDGLERIDVNGFSAATGVVRLATPDGPRDVRLVAIEVAPGEFGRFMFITRPETTNRLAVPLQRATYSFRPMTASEASAFRPRRIDVLTARAGDTAEALAQRMPFEDYRLERFLALNGLDDPAGLRPGREVKLVVR